MKGSRETATKIVRQPIPDVVESPHTRYGFSRDQMEPRAAAERDELATARTKGISLAASSAFDTATA